MNTSRRHLTFDEVFNPEFLAESYRSSGPDVLRRVVNDFFDFAQEDFASASLALARGNFEQVEASARNLAVAALDLSFQRIAREAIILATIRSSDSPAIERLSEQMKSTREAVLRWIDDNAYSLRMAQ